MGPDHLCLMDLISGESHRRGSRMMELPDHRIRRGSRRLQTFGVGGAGQDTRPLSRDWFLGLEQMFLHPGRRQADRVE